ncbi:MAG: hypothetical protein EZS28_047862, partial [Streblomastix strix]
DNLSETRLATTLRPCPFKGTPRTNKAYKEILQTELEEGIIKITSQELIKCWNSIFTVPKPDLKVLQYFKVLFFALIIYLFFISFKNAIFINLALLKS